ncbi:PREDICTED: eukaryotic translation elongation factor 1 epsilon-1 [Nanorana parkeri]|uniref:eukaryotic translation elongation factor 1 epsilon-1 n=1 Tax=Nanorana parkeri TaxID=125878 RepID=UPI000853FAA6|nr:PREDICTED: eukaryotic translation elongation factor 1 epsilon-1 [Nanorana parkeri]
MAVEELSALEKCLGLKAGKYSSRAQGESQIPVLQTNKGPSLVGLATIASHLVAEAKKEELLGVSAEEKAIVQQWLEYRITRIDRLSSKEDVRNLLKDLNMYLEDKVYMAGNKITLADIIIYYGLHPVIADLSVQEKETCINVSRWFSHIQHFPGVRQHFPSLVFIKNRIYTNIH